MKRQRLAFIVLGLVLALLVAVSGAAGSAQKGPGTHGKAQPNMDMRWDIVSLNLATSTLTRGGHASAYATASGGTAHTGKITLTGGGTFTSNPGKPQNVTGGGTWQTFDAAGAPNGNGTYDVTGFVDFDIAPGSLPASITDNSGLLGARAGASERGREPDELPHASLTALTERMPDQEVQS